MKPRTNPFAAQAKPVTRDQWQVCADVANLALTLEQARQFGLLDDRGRVNVDLCTVRLDEAKQRFAIVPRNPGPGKTNL